MSYLFTDYLADQWTPVEHFRLDRLDDWWNSGWARPATEFARTTYVPYLPAPSTPSPNFFVSEVPDRFNDWTSNPVRAVWDEFAYAGFRKDPLFDPLWGDLTSGRQFTDTVWNSFRSSSPSDFGIVQETLGLRGTAWLGDAARGLAAAARAAVPYVKKAAVTAMDFTPQGRTAKLAWWAAKNLAWEGAMHAANWTAKEYREHFRDRNPKPPVGPPRDRRHRGIVAYIDAQEFEYLAVEASALPRPRSVPDRGGVS